MEEWNINDLIEIKNDWKKLAQEQAEMLQKIREIVNRKGFDGLKVRDIQEILMCNTNKV